MIWQQLLVALIFFVVGEIIRPTPDFNDAEAIPFEDLPLPQNNPQAKQPVIWGSNLLTAPHLMDISEYSTVEITDNVRTSIFNRERVVIGHRYFIGMQLGICKGPADLLAIYYDDKLLWQGLAEPDNDGVAIEIDLPDFLGGSENGGGIVGTFRYYGGLSTQNVNPYLSAFQNPQPAYRFTAYIVFENVEVGESPNIDGFAFYMRRHPDPLTMGDTTNKIDGEGSALEDINPISIISEIFLDNDFGFGRPISELNGTSLGAAGVTLKNELIGSGVALGMSLKWTNNQTIERILDTVQKHVDGVTRFDPKTGQWDHKLVRDDFDVGSLLVLDESNITRLNRYSRANYDETANYVEVTWTNRFINTQKATPAKAYDRANFNRQGRHVVSKLTFPGCNYAAQASGIAHRELKQLGFPVAGGDLNATRAAWQLLPGDPFVFAFQVELEIVQLVCRVTSIAFGDMEQSELQIGFVEDIFSLADAVFGDVPSPVDTTFNGAPAVPTVFDFFDAPYFFSLLDDSPTKGTDHKPVSVAKSPQANALNYRLFWRDTAVEGVAVSDAVSGYLPSGTLQVPLRESTGDGELLTTLVVEDVDFTVLLSDLTGTAQSIDDQIKIQGFNLAILISTVVDPFDGTAVYEPELIAYETVTISGSQVTLENVHRGIMDTLPIEATTGDRIWFLTGSELNGPGSTEQAFSSADVLDMTISNIATTGESSQTSPQTLTMRNRVARPYPAGGVTVNGARYPVGVVAAGGDIDLAWLDRDRLLNTIPYQDDPTDTIETDREVVIRIYNGGFTGGTLVRKVVESGSTITADGSETLDTYTGNSYDYTNALQITDGGGDAMGQVRIEIRVTDAAETTFNIVDVIRLVAVDVPLNFNKRGAVYNAIIQEDPVAYWPMANESGGALQVIDAGASGDATATGNLGYRNPGPDIDSFSMLFPDDGANYLSIADSADTAWSNDGVWLTFFFRCAPKASGSLPTVIVYQGLTGTGDVTDTGVNWKFEIGTDGRARFIYTPGTDNIALQGSTQRRFDDGEWHCVTIGGTAVHMLIDGFLIGIGAVGGMSGESSTQPIIIGNGPDATNNERRDLQIAHFAIWNPNVDATPAMVTTTDMAAAGAHIHIVREAWLSTSPYLRAVWSLDPSIHLEMGNLWINLPGNNAVEPDWTGRAFQNSFTAADAPAWQGSAFAGSDVRLAGPFSNQRSHAVRVNAQAISVGSQNTNALQSVGFDPDATDTTVLGWLYVESTFTAAGDLWWYGTSGIGQRRWYFRINADRTLTVFASEDDPTTTYSETTDEALPTEEWFMIGFAASGGNVERHQIYVNGVPVATTQGGNSNPRWMSDRIDSNIGAADFFDGNATASIQLTDCRVAHWSWWVDRRLDDKDFAILYAAGFDPELTMTEMFSRDNPEHVIPLEAAADAADLFAMSADGNPTATGTPEEDTLPIERDTQDALLTPLGFRASEYVTYASALFESVGTGDIDDITLMVLLRSIGPKAADMFAIWNANSVESNTNVNLGLNIGDNDAEWFVDPASGAGLSTPANSFEDMTSHLVALRESGSGGAKARSFWIDHIEEASDTGDNDEYTGTAVDALRVGERNTDNTEPLDGDVAYIAGFARAVSDQVIRRAVERYLGKNRYAIAVLQHGGSTLFMLDEDPLDGTRAHNTASDVDRRDMTYSANKPGVVVGNAFPGMYFPRLHQCVSVNSESIEGASQIDGTLPFTIGVLCRVDLASADAYVSVSDATQDNAWLAVGLFGDAAGFRIGNAGGDLTRTSGAVTQGDMVFVCVVFNAGDDKDIYLNGELQVKNTVSDTLPTGLDTQAINNIVEDTANTFGDGSYAGYFAIPSALNAQQVMEIDAAARLDFARAASIRDGATMHYPLDEYVDAQLAYHDSIDRTNVGTATGVTQGAVGIIPQRKSLCVDFDGSGNIGLARTDYPTGSGNRVFEFWVDGGFDGVVCSMGANTDAQSFTIAIDTSGDVRVHIRGTGNERIFTTAIDTGTEHHVVVELNGTLLTDINCYVNGVLATVGTAGSGTTVNTTATENLVLGALHANLTTLPAGTPYVDATGKLQHFTVYNAEFGADTTESAVKALAHNDLARLVA